jgi:hypothetical protein
MKGANGLTFIQAALKEDSSWVVEFQDGHLDQHFRTSQIVTANVIQLFLSYLHGEESWRESVDWEPIEL